MMKTSGPSILPQINMASIDPRKQTRETTGTIGEKEMPTVANTCFLLTSLAGAALLVCWAMQFHQDNRQLWMVPFGLILMGTPIVVWFALSASDVWRSLETLAGEPEKNEVRKKQAEFQDPEK